MHSHPIGTPSRSWGPPITSHAANKFQEISVVRLDSTRDSTSATRHILSAGVGHPWQAGTLHVISQMSLVAQGWPVLPADRRDCMAPGAGCKEVPAKRREMARKLRVAQIPQLPRILPVGSGSQRVPQLRFVSFRPRAAEGDERHEAPRLRASGCRTTASLSTS